MKPLFILLLVSFLLNPTLSFSQNKQESNCEIPISGVVLDSLTKKTLFNAKVVLYDINKEDFVLLKKDNTVYIQNTKLQNKTVVSTDEVGHYTTVADCNKYYFLIVTINGFITKTQLFTTTQENNKTCVFNFTLENQEVYIDNSKQFLVKTKPIQFEINSSNITKESKRELNKVVMLLKKYNNFKIEISVHASSLGSDAFNLKLTQHRADEIHNYITSFNWLNKERLTARGYGETKLLNECVNGAKCRPEKHKENKRVEFLLQNIYIPTSDMEYLNRTVSEN